MLQCCSVTYERSCQCCTFILMQFVCAVLVCCCCWYLKIACQLATETTTNRKIEYLAAHAHNKSVYKCLVLGAHTRLTGVLQMGQVLMCLCVFVLLCWTCAATLACCACSRQLLIAYELCGNWWFCCCLCCCTCSFLFFLAQLCTKFISCAEWCCHVALLPSKLPFTPLVAAHLPSRCHQFAIDAFPMLMLRLQSSCDFANGMDHCYLCNAKINIGAC